MHEGKRICFVCIFVWAVFFLVRKEIVFASEVREEK
ncbi:MAG: hypothetical protein PWP24_1554, partial [Clostridiales bacterium]|nr:hypothetical protein [Clostridiales bacterium]